MNSFRVIPIVILLAGTACTQKDPSPGAVASFNGGTVDLEAVEQSLPTEVDAVDQVDRNLLVEAYRTQARRIAFEQTLLHRPSQPDEEAVDLEPFRRRVTLDLYKAENLSAPNPVTPEMVEKYYSEHPEEFHREPRRFVWHIFRRFPGKKQSGDTVAELEAIRRKAINGQGFSQLAWEWSESETRFLGGRLGWIGRGKLPPSIETVLFSLDKDEISPPITVAGGAAIFMVSEIIPDTRLTLDDVRVKIYQSLFDDEVMKRITETVGETAPPDGSVVLDETTFLESTTQALPDDVLLEISGYRVTARDLSDRVFDGVARLPGVPFFQPDPWKIYNELLMDQLLYLCAIENGFPDTPETTAMIEKSVKAEADAVTIDWRIEAAIHREATGNPEAIKAFFETNRFLYQTPLLLKLKSLSLPLEEPVNRATARIASVRQAVENGETTPAEAAAKTGADLVELGWNDIDSIKRLTQKLSHYVLAVEAGHTTIPFQLNHRLNIILVEERKEPEPLAFEEVEDQVISDFVERHQQELYSQLETEVLDDVRFRFHEETVLRALE